MAACVAAMLTVACGGDAARATSPTPVPPGGNPGAPNGAPTVIGMRAELVSLYGEAAPAIADAIGRRRRAADSLLAADALRLVDAEIAPAAGTEPPAARVMRAISARETATSETVNTGGRELLIETRAVSEPTFDPVTTTMRVTQDFTVAVSPVGTAGKAYRTNAFYAFDLPACPAANGTSSGRLLAVGRAWHRTNAPAGEGADSLNAERRRETRVDGEVLLRVDDAAELAGVDLSLNLSASWDNGTGAPLRGSARLTWPGAPASVFSQAYAPSRLSARSGDLDALDALGYGPQDRYALAMDLAGTQAQAARTLWRGGRCVRVELARGHIWEAVLPGATVPLGPEAKSRLDGTTVTTARVTATTQRGAVSPATAVAHPATFQFTMPDAPSYVDFRATSRRGIGTLHKDFTPAVPDTATITYVATSSYLFDRTGPGGDGTMTGSVTGRMEIASRVRFVFDRKEESVTYYKVLADSRIAVAGQGAVEARKDRQEVVWTMALSGADSTHNPRTERDAPLVQGRTVSPEDSRPGTEAGELKVTQIGLLLHYELYLRVGQIHADYTTSGQARSICAAGGVAEHKTTYDNRSRATVEKSVHGVGPQGITCSFPGPEGTWTTVAAAPLTWGAIFYDRSQRAPAPGIGALVRGSWAPGGFADSGEENGTVTSCDRVRMYDPTQMGTKFLTMGYSPPDGLDGAWDTGGVTCRLQYTITWKLPQP